MKNYFVILGNFRPFLCLFQLTFPLHFLPGFYTYILYEKCGAVYLGQFTKISMANNKPNYTFRKILLLLFQFKYIC